jgi:hypothetical protein
VVANGSGLFSKLALDIHGAKPFGFSSKTFLFSFFFFPYS